MFFTSPPCRRPVNALHKTLYIVVINVHLLNADACSAKPRMTNHWSFLVVVVVIIVRPNLMGPEWVAVSSIYPLAHKGLRVTQKHCNWIGITGKRTVLLLCTHNLFYYISHHFILSRMSESLCRNETHSQICSSSAKLVHRRYGYSIPSAL